MALAFATSAPKHGYTASNTLGDFIEIAKRERPSGIEGLDKAQQLLNTFLADSDEGKQLSQKSDFHDYLKASLTAWFDNFYRPSEDIIPLILNYMTLEQLQSFFPVFRCAVAEDFFTVLPLIDHFVQKDLTDQSVSFGLFSPYLAKMMMHRYISQQPISNLSAFFSADDSIKFFASTMLGLYFEAKPGITPTSFRDDHNRGVATAVMGFLLPCLPKPSRPFHLDDQANTVRDALIHHYLDLQKGDPKADCKTIISNLNEYEKEATKVIGGGVGCFIVNYFCFLQACFYPAAYAAIGTGAAWCVCVQCTEGSTAKRVATGCKLRTQQDGVLFCCSRNNKVGPAHSE